MQDVANVSFLASTLSTTSGDMTLQLTTPYWPVGPNVSAAVVMFSAGTTPISPASAGDTTLFADFDSTIGLSSVPSRKPRRRRREQTGYDVVSDFLEKYYSQFLLLFGTLGNVLCFGVLSRKTFRRSTIGIFLRFLTLADLSALWTGVFYFAAKSILHTNIRKTSELSCKIHFWLSYASCDLSSWTLVLVSSARLASILRPMSHFITNRRAYGAILMTCLLALCVNLPIYFMYGDLTDPIKGYTRRCTIVDKSNRYFILYVWTWIVLVKFALVPGLILLALNVVLIMHVYRSKRIIQDMQRSSLNKGYRGKSREEESKHDSGGHCINDCGTCCPGLKTESLKISHLGKSFKKKISFSRWRRKAVVLAKSENPDLDKTHPGELQGCIPLGKGVNKEASETYKTQLCINGNASKVVSKLLTKPFQPSDKAKYVYSTAEIEHPKEEFKEKGVHSQTSKTSIHSPATSLSTDTCANKAVCNISDLHQSYADIKQLRDVLSSMKTSVSLEESAVSSIFRTPHSNRSGLFKSCSDIPSFPATPKIANTGLSKNHSAFSRLKPLTKLESALQKRGTPQGSTKSSTEQFYTDPGQDIITDALDSLSSSLNASRDFITYDKIEPPYQQRLGMGSDIEVENAQIPLMNNEPDVEITNSSCKRSNLIEKCHVCEGCKKNSQPKTEGVACSVTSCDDLSDSSSDEFFSCADEMFHLNNRSFSVKDNSSLLRGNTTNHLSKQSRPTATCIPIQVISIPNEETDARETAPLTSTPMRRDISINIDKEKQYHCDTDDCTNPANLKATQPDSCALPKTSTQPTSEVSRGMHSPTKFPLIINSIAENDCSVLCSDTNSHPMQTYGSTESGAKNDSLKVLPNCSICDINVTRCSSANDVISLSDHSQCRIHDATSKVRKSGNNEEISSSVKDQPQGSKAGTLCVERKLSTKKRDCAVSLTDLNISLSSLGRNSLASGATDISSFTIAAPSAFTSIENLTTTTNAEMLRKVGGGQKQSTSCQHATSAVIDKHRGHQKKKSKSSSMFPKSSARPKNLTRTLLVINSVFLICNIPIVIYLTGKTYFFPGGYNDRQNLFNTVANFTMYTNNALNFLLYCLTGTRFRHQLRAMFWDFGDTIRGSIRRRPRRAYV